MELSCAPRSFRRCRPRTPLTRIRVDPVVSNELFVDRVNVGDNEPIGRAIDAIRPLLWTRPLKMDLHTITPDCSVLRLVRIVLEGQSEPKATVKLH